VNIVSSDQDKAAMRSVSHYASYKATGSLNEFVAEYCAAKIAGFATTLEADTLYATAGGPPIPDEAKVIAKLLKGMGATGY
jgi:hypothetical protein